MIVLAASVRASGDQGVRSWPPAFQSVGAESPVLSPEEEIRTFVLPPGYRVELVASEPMVEDPVLIDWDSRGRLWVVEMLGYMPDLRATDERKPTGRVSVLEDPNGDGRMDTKTVFLDRLVLPRALKVLEGGVLIAEPPHLWFARDTNGDLKADQGIGVRLLRLREGERRAQRQQPAVGDGQLDLHVGGRDLPAAKERKVRRQARR